VDGIELLARRDCVYSAATAPACPYLHFPIVLRVVAGIGVEPILSSLWDCLGPGPPCKKLAEG